MIHYIIYPVALYSRRGAGVGAFPSLFFCNTYKKTTFPPSDLAASDSLPLHDDSLTKRSLKCSYSLTKGAAVCPALGGSPTSGYIPFKVAFSIYHQFPLVPRAKLPLKLPFKFTFQIYL